jgi:hypothetical protein
MNTHTEEYLRYYKDRPELLSGIMIGNTPVEYAVGEAAYKAVVELGRFELIPDVAQEVLVSVFAGEDTAKLSKDILLKRAKRALSEMTEQINPAYHVTPTEIPKSLILNQPKVVQDSLDDLNPAQRQYFEDLLDGRDELEANLLAWPRKNATSHPESEKNRIRRNRSDANTALSKAANRKAARGTFVSYESLKDGVISGAISDSVYAINFVGPSSAREESMYPYEDENYGLEAPQMDAEPQEEQEVPVPMPRHRSVLEQDLSGDSEVFRRKVAESWGDLLPAVAR